MKSMDRQQTHKWYRKVLSSAKERDELYPVMADLGRRDLFFLLVYILKRPDIDRDWLFDRCREVQKYPNNYLDLWAREHYKSTIISFGLTIQDVLVDPEITVGIFSVTRPLAKDLLHQIREELEKNKLLYQLYPDVLYENPRKEAPSWSLDEGIILKRKTNPREATIEANGLIDGMPTGKHYSIRLYDDIITEKHVTSVDMIKKATTAWELSLSLGSKTVSRRYGESDIARYAGTRYHLNDPYKEIMKRKTAKPRIYPATIDGETSGEPVLWSREEVAKRRKDQGSYTFGCQMLQDPTADEAQGFKEEWLRYWIPKDWTLFNRYLLCDPAGEKKKENDYTVIGVIGLGADKNYYLIDALRDRLNLTERARAYIKFHRLYTPIASGYEKYGKDSDIEAIEWLMEQQNYRFEIIPLGGATPKNDRIRKLIPIFENSRFFIPARLLFMARDKKQHDFTRELIDEEYISFPVGDHDDMLDFMARIVDPALGAVFPDAILEQAMHGQHNNEPEEYDPFANL